MNARLTKSPCYRMRLQLLIGGARQHQRCRSSRLALAQFLFKGEISVQLPLTNTSFLAQILLKSSVRLYFLET